MITSQEIRFECLKIAARIEPSADPRQVAELLVDYVQTGLINRPGRCQTAPYSGAVETVPLQAQHACGSDA